MARRKRCNPSLETPTSSTAPSQLHTLALFSRLAVAAAPGLPLAGRRPRVRRRGAKRTHVRVYVHERFSGPNATVLPVAPSRLGDNSTFGEVGVLDDEVRAGQHRRSALVGRYQGVFVGTDLADETYLSAITLVFDAGEHRGSTLSLQGKYSFPGDDTVERAVVGGTGKFRMAQGYSLLKVVDTPPEAAVFQLDLFVFTPRGRY